MKSYDTNSASFFVYDKYIIAEPKVDTDVNKKEVEILNDIVSKHFKGDFGLIENRINKNSINPLVYQYAKDLMPNFSAFALVVYSVLAKDYFDMESIFIEEANVKCELFHSLEDAKEWMENVL